MSFEITDSRQEVQEVWGRYKVPGEYPEPEGIHAIERDENVPGDVDDNQPPEVFVLSDGSIVREGQPDSSDVEQVSAAAGAKALHATGVEMSGHSLEVADEHASVQETSQPTETPGQRAMDEIRDLFRTKRLSYKGATMGPKAETQYGAEYGQTNAAVKAWRSQFPGNDNRAGEVARRFTGAWLKYSRAMALQGVAVTCSAQEALEAYYNDTVHAETVLGYGKSAAGCALFNTRAEFSEALSEARAAGISETDLRILASRNKTDILASVKSYADNAEAIQRALASEDLRDAPPLDERAFRFFAQRGVSPADSVDRAKEYLKAVARLTEQYEDVGFVTNARIREVCRMFTDPEDAMADKVATIERLTAEYKGKGALTRGDITECVFDTHKLGTILDRLDRCVELGPQVATALDNRLSPQMVKVLILKNDDPVQAGLDMLRDVDKLKERMAEHPNAGLLRESDYASLVRHYGKSAVSRAGTFASNYAHAREHFVGDIRVTEEVMRIASLVEGGDVVRLINDKLDVLAGLSAQYDAGEVPRWMLNRVLRLAAPQSGMEGKKAMLDRVTLTHGEQLLPNTIRQLCGHQSNPMGRIKDRLPTLEKTWERYGIRYAIHRSRIEGAVVLAANVQTALRAVLGDAILEDIHSLHQAHPRLGRGPIASYTRPVYDRMTSTIGDWVGGLGLKGAEAEAVQRAFRDAWWGYSRHRHPDSAQDDIVGRAVFDTYYDNVLAMRTLGFSAGQAAQLAKTHRLDDVITRLEEFQTEVSSARQSDERRDRATPRPVSERQTARTAEPPSLKEAQAAVREVFGPDKNLTDPVLRRALKYQDWMGAVSRYAENIHALPAKYKGRAGVDKVVIKRFAMVFDAEASIGKYLEKYDLLAQHFGDDDDYSPAVFRELALTHAKDRLDDEAVAWKQRYQEIRRAAALEGIDSEVLKRIEAGEELDNETLRAAISDRAGEYVARDEALRQAVIDHKSGDIDKRLAFAHYLDRQMELREIRLQAALRDKGSPGRRFGGRTKEEGVSDPEAQGTEDIVLDSIDRQEQIRLLVGALEEVSEQDRLALFTSYGLESRVSKAEMSKVLRRNVDEYVAGVVIPKLQEATARR
ncbi:MAG TPA: hypothetical protein VFT16_03665 [Candidatus Saccharimonadales bacterium]|nr:hypothetical protein [Candidatus Saccharimonadales bacterium]